MIQYFKRLLKRPSDSFFLLGPRGTGKSTWVNNEFKDAYLVDLLDEEIFQSFLSDVSLFKKELMRLEDNSWVIIDEIQRLPSLLNYVHWFIEKRQMKFALTGSSARKLKKADTNLLAGRAITKSMYPLLPEELKEEVSIDAILQHGSLPVIWQSQNKKDKLKAYVQLYLKEEIQTEGLVRNLPGFARFLPIAAIFHGQIINISNIARDAGVHRNTVSGFLQILEDTLLGFKIPAFEGKIKAREKKHPKFYLFDPGVVRAIKNQFGQVSMEEKGPLFEGWIANMLRFYGEHNDLFDELYYWSPAELKNTEVDFLLKKENRFIAIEVKAATRLRPEHFNGLKAIKNLSNLRRRILIYLGCKSLKTDDSIEVYSINDFCREISNLEVC